METARALLELWSKAMAVGVRVSRAARESGTTAGACRIVPADCTHSIDVLNEARISTSVRLVFKASLTNLDQGYSKTSRLLHHLEYRLEWDEWIVR